MYGESQEARKTDVLRASVFRCFSKKKAHGTEKTTLSEILGGPPVAGKTKILLSANFSTSAPDLFL